MRSLLSDKDRWAVLMRDRFRCVFCGHQATWWTAWSLAVDHKTPVSRGGSDAMENLQTTCGACNRQKGERTDAEFRPELALLRRVFGF